MLQFHRLKLLQDIEKTLYMLRLYQQRLQCTALTTTNSTTTLSTNVALLLQRKQEQQQLLQILNHRLMSGPEDSDENRDHRAQQQDPTQREEPNRPAPLIQEDPDDTDSEEDSDEDVDNEEENEEEDDEEEEEKAHEEREDSNCKNNKRTVLTDTSENGNKRSCLENGHADCKLQSKRSRNSNETESGSDANDTFE